MAGFSVCAACLALAHAQRAQGQIDEQTEKSGGVISHAARLWQVVHQPDPST